MGDGGVAKKVVRGYEKWQYIQMEVVGGDDTVFDLILLSIIKFVSRSNDGRRAGEVVSSICVMLGSNSRVIPQAHRLGLSVRPVWLRW